METLRALRMEMVMKAMKVVQMAVQMVVQMAVQMVSLKVDG
jgi:hypothetical protein